MQLTQYTDYALRTLIALGLDPGRKLTVADVATAYGISRNHLVKVAARLAEAGYVETTRGKGGGMRLARPPGDIRLGAVVRDMEAELGVVECLTEGGGHCVLSQACRLKSLLHDATGAFLYTLDRYTLEDLLRQPQPVARLLHIPVRLERRA
jgi:Rrf2 family transcriptional regulator, nitric oxide-sensitive transcriptional repressor